MGKLNILHHKSWHVYNRDNIERVKRDEALAQLEAESKSQQSLAADSEARLTLLREHARKEKEKGGRKRESEAEKALTRQLEGKGKGREEDDVRATIVRPEGRSRGDGEADDAGPSEERRKQQEDSISTAEGHINFWAAQESGAVASQPRAQNASYMRDKKKEEDKWEEQVTMYLGKPAKELRPWYSDREFKSGEERKRTDEQRLELAFKDGESKRLSDPLAAMNGYLARREAALASQRGQRDPTSARRAIDGSARSPSPDSFRPLMLSSRRKRRAASRSPTPPPTPMKGKAAEKGEDGDEDFAPALPPHMRSVKALPTTSTALTTKARAGDPPPVKTLRVDASAERAKAQVLLATEASKRRRLMDDTPRSTRTGMLDDDDSTAYGDAYNRDAVREAREARKMRGRSGRREEDGARWRRDRSRERRRYWEDDRR